jgi:leucyl-tRNA synthetase
MARKSFDDAEELDRAIRRAPACSSRSRARNDSIEVFTTRIDTIFGATFMMLAPEHGLVATFAKESEDEKAFLAKAQKFRAQDRAGRLTARSPRKVSSPADSRSIPTPTCRSRSGSRITCSVNTEPAR